MSPKKENTFARIRVEGPDAIHRLEELANKPPSGLRELDVSFLELSSSAVKPLRELIAGGPVRSLNLRGNQFTGDDLRELFEPPGDLESLDVLGNAALDAAGLETALKSRGLSNLKALTIGFNSSLSALEAAPFLPNLIFLCAPACDAKALPALLGKAVSLEHLDIHQSTAVDFDALAGSEARGTLRGLVLFSCRGSDFGDWSGHWPELRELNLRGLAFGEGLRDATFPELRELNVMETGLKAKGANILARVDWPKLETLLAGGVRGEGRPAAGHNAITGPALSKLLPRMPNLKTLDLEGSPIGEQGIAAIVGTDRPLDFLNLSACRLPPSAGKLLARSRLPASVVELDLSHQPPGSPGVGALGSADFPLLNRLSLNNTDLRGPGLENLLQGSFPRLESLHLTHNKIGSAARLLAQADLPSLNLLLLHWNSIPRADLEAVRAAHPDWTIHDSENIG